MVSVQMLGADFVEIATNTVISSAFYFSTYIFELQANQSGRISDVQYTNYIAADSTEVLELEMQIGDVGGVYSSEQRLFYTDSGGNLKETSEWNGSGKKIQEVILSEIIDMRSKNIRLYSGTFLETDPTTTDGHHLMRFIHRSLAFWFLRVTHNTAADTYSGVWYEIANAFTGAGTPPTTPNYTVQAPDDQNLRDEPLLLLPGNNSKQFQAPTPQTPDITKTSDILTSGATVTQIDVNATTSKLYAGDQILIYDPTAGKSDVLTVAADTAIGATSISVNSYTLTNEWSAGATVTVNPKYVSENAMTLQNVKTYVFTDVTDDFINIPSETPLPDPAVVTTDAEYNGLVDVIGDALYIYRATKTRNNHFSVDVAGANNKIIFKRKQRGNDFKIRIIKI